jgi:hypothetical protein
MKEIPLTQGQVAKVDDEDYEWLTQWKWCARWAKNTQSYYAIRNNHADNSTILMSREVMKTPSDMQCDHIHHNTLDNRKSELRNCTQTQNAHNRKTNRNNTSGYKGVYKISNTCWRARITINSIKWGLGCFRTAKEAGAAFDNAAKTIRGAYAN